MDILHKFLFDGLPLKGAIVRLDASWQELLRRQMSEDSANTVYPEAVQSLLGQMVAAACLMQSSIKFNGALILQIQGGETLPLAVAEVQADLTFRAMAQSGSDLPSAATYAQLLEGAQCAVTLDPRDRQPGQTPYQGIVALSDEKGRALPTLAQGLNAYMAQSEQIETHFILAANGQTAAGIFLQKIPVAGAGNLQSSAQDAHSAAGETQAQACERILSHTLSLQADELLNLDIETILHRLYWEDKLLRFHAPTNECSPRFACTCSRERVAQMLKNMGADEANSIAREQGAARIVCGFCGLAFVFDAVDTALLFQEGVVADESDTRH